MAAIQSNVAAKNVIPLFYIPRGFKNLQINQEKKFFETKKGKKKIKSLKR